MWSSKFVQLWCRRQLGQPIAFGNDQSVGWLDRLIYLGYNNTYSILYSPCHLQKPIELKCCGNIEIRVGLPSHHDFYQILMYLFLGLSLTVSGRCCMMLLPPPISISFKAAAADFYILLSFVLGTARAIKGRRALPENLAL